MKQHFYKYQGTGNDFIMIDNRTPKFPKKDVNLIHSLCDRRFGIGADGLILLESSGNYDFKMVYYNADGNEGSMCGNGGRCIVAFAKHLSIIDQETTFDAVDGFHYASIKNSIVSLKMIDINTVEVYENHLFLNTGSPHHVSFENDVSLLNVKELGAKIRYGAPYLEEGANINFAEKITDNSFKVRTYERGVEDETLACGTGVTAVAIAANVANITQGNSINIEVLGGQLEVSFNKEGSTFKNIFLKGPAELVFEGNISI